MSLGFVAPLFLLGVAAVALPLWLHRLQTRSARREPFSSAMLLEEAERQVHVRRRLRYRVLLALRLLVLLLVAFAFARPYLAGAPVAATAEAGTALVVLDTSASMTRPGVFDRARAVAADIVAARPSGTLVGVLTADDRVRVVAAPSPDRTAAATAVASARAGATRLDFGVAMRAIDRLAGTLTPPVAVHFVSDFQASGMPVRFSDLVSTGVAELQTHRVGGMAAPGHALQFVRPVPGGVDVGLDAAGGPATVTIAVNGVDFSTRSVDAPGRVRLSFTALPLEEGDNAVTVRLGGDREPGYDDAGYAIVENLPARPVPVITDDPAGLAFTYLAAALEAGASAGHRAVPLAPATFDPRVLARHEWLIVADLAVVDAGLERILRDYLDAGGQVLAFAGANTGATVPLGGQRVRGDVLRRDAFARVGRMDATHPLLAGTRGWHNVGFSAPLNLETRTGDAVLIELEEGAPLLIEQHSGAGRLLVMAAGLENRDNDLPVRPVFVGFLQQAARYLSADAGVARAYTTGDVLPLTLVSGASGQVIDPDGKPVLSLADTTRAQRIRLEKPGIYEVYTPRGEYLVAANVDRRELDYAPAADEALARWRNAVTGLAAARVDPVTTAGDDTELARWLLLALALAVIAESVLGNAHLAPQRHAGAG